MNIEKAIEQALRLFPWQTAQEVHSVILEGANKATVLFKDGDICYIF